VGSLAALELLLAAWLVRHLKLDADFGSPLPL